MARLVYPVPLAVASRATLLDLLRYVVSLEIIFGHEMDELGLLIGQ